MNVADVCTREIAIAVRERSLQEAAALMRVPQMQLGESRIPVA